MNNVTQIHQKTAYHRKEIPLTKCLSCSAWTWGDTYLKLGDFSAWTWGDTYLKLGHWLKVPLYMPVP